MAIKTTVIGAYPKPPDEGRPFALRKALNARDKDADRDRDVHAEVDRLASEMLAEQDAAGIDIPTDGHPGWEDILTPFARNIAGFEIGGLLRWFDNNVYYRRPVATGQLEWRGPTSVEAFRSASSKTTRPLKAVVPGPLTFARLSIDEHYGSHESFVLALAEVLAQEAFELEAAGCRYLQIDEPALLDAPEDLELAGRALARIAGELRSDETETILATYFSDAKRLGAELFDLPVARFGLDLVAGPENLEVVRQLPDGKKLQAGVVDSRNTKLEPVNDLAELVGRVRESGGDDLWIAPSASLEFLPREKARAKLERLVEAARKVDA